mmetsp:Transcript_12969/g.17474  ORF Transcript_12969/g.17474 Transcript_12969/m.17474 type:complete len:228 (+) Transcript_12969:552-1235(+)|eukprot:CAMPEP_0185585110 /NCGR_PEP_ID=MMETSP0434-20130131/36580_1 /TAXON_ID=626734 ORGANISM="Favella taraikaensis, Strain Fe Narragansett Bay" /NCGR_SAMPLE_ID=MMETSP0434 /ASSEMBLY_ACC=CAM_ASM_000379 /LENGTH=227 /DNA_ID=CAMNT_0028205247 /DNA_START=494 /DNA_END=1177 /DNA_ORIENTATION=+
MLKDGNRLSSSSKKRDRKDKKKHKKHHKSSKKSKKDKKNKHRHRSSSSEDSSVSRRSRSRSSSPEERRRRRHRSRSRSDDSQDRRHRHRSSRRRDSPKRPDYYSRSALLQDHAPSKKESEKSSQSKSQNLGPDMSLYGDRLKQINEMDRLRKEKVESSKRSTPLNASEREAKLAEMQAASLALNDLRKDRSGYTKAKEEAKDGADDDKNGAKFLKQIRTSVYMDSEM